MKFPEPLESQKLSFLLEKAASREALMWKAYVPKKSSTQDTDISPGQRDEAVRWLVHLHSKLRLYPETLFLAVSILDRFLAAIKARPKYLPCIAITCFFLAAKTNEEDERIPSLRELASSSSCGCSPSEILRMERIVLDKLNWDLHTATPLDFLQIFHAMVLSCKAPSLAGLLGSSSSPGGGMSPSQHLALLTQRLLLCLADLSLLGQTRGSTLALGLLTLELESCCPDWLALTVDLLRKAQIDSSQLICCRERVARSLSTPHQASLPPNTVFIYQPLRQSLEPCARGGGGGEGGALPRRPPALTLTTAPTPASAQAQALAAADRTSTTTTSTTLITPALLSPPHLRPRPTMRLCVKPSAKRKVEQMEVDEFFDGIKRLYNEEAPAESGGGAGETPRGCSSVLVPRQEGGSPCPPLQPVRVP
ncbi:cyclin-I [Engraulis encrasicolus]|uniref:cyclin-I n=1 Tax=Engraulis encrasicolus TaxID=184585 RepID=UPI002FD6A0BA